MTREQAFVAIVGHDLVFVETVQLLLAMEGYQSIACLRAADAQMLAQQQRPDVIVLNIPEAAPEPGWRVLEDLRRDPATRAIPVIVSAGAIDVLRQREEQLSAYGSTILIKPYSLNALLAAIEARVSSARARANGG